MTSAGSSQVRALPRQVLRRSRSHPQSHWRVVGDGRMGEGLAEDPPIFGRFWSLPKGFQECPAHSGGRANDRMGERAQLETRRGFMWKQPKLTAATMAATTIRMRQHAPWSNEVKSCGALCCRMESIQVLTRYRQVAAPDRLAYRWDFGAAEPKSWVSGSRGPRVFQGLPGMPEILGV